MWVDTHCHLTYEEDGPHLGALLGRAREAGVGAFVAIGCRAEEIHPLTTLANTYEDVFFSAGIHPHEAEATLKEYTPDTLYALLKQATHHPKLLAIGETGLDYYYDHSPRDLQKDVFRLQLELALEKDLPVVIHTRNADDDTISLLREVGQGRIRGVLHCFSGTRTLYEEGLALGLYISASGIVTFKKSDDLRAIFKDVPLERLLLETDAPYLAPMPHRGKRNESGFMIHTAQCMAELKDIPMDSLQEQTTRNFFTLFTKAQPFYPERSPA